MKKMILIAAIVMVLGMVTLAQATLIDRGADTLGYHLIYDTDRNITWYDFTNSFGSWNNQMSWASGLTVNFGGTIYDDWRLPTTVDGQYVFGWDGTTTGGYNITTSEMGHLFYEELGNKGYYATNGTYPQPGWGLVNKGLFSNLQATYYWSGTVTASHPGNAWLFVFDSGFQDENDQINSRSALAVRSGDIAAVPEPATMLLLGLGLIGIAGMRRKMQR